MALLSWDICRLAVLGTMPAAASQAAHPFPPMEGDPVRLEIRRELADRRGAVHASAFVRKRRIAFDAETAADPQEFARIFVHEIFLFVWLRLGNPRRWSYDRAREVYKRLLDETE